MMEVTGYMIREAIKRHERRRDTAGQRFENSLHYFEGEPISDPMALYEEYRNHEEAIVGLQDALTEYNHSITAGTHTLAVAVKRVGGVGRAEKMWRASVVSGDKHDLLFGHSRQLARKGDEERAKRTLGEDICLKIAEGLADELSQLRADIAAANAIKLEMGVDPSLFE